MGNHTLGPINMTATGKENTRFLPLHGNAEGTSSAWILLIFIFFCQNVLCTVLLSPQEHVTELSLSV